MNMSNLKQDFWASITVTLVAIPLCLGISLASGTPLFSGILTGVIGGIVVGFLSESRVSVSGPAAGMIAVIIAAIAQLGSFQLFLTALMIAGLMQIFAGVFRLGFIANFIPTNVIQGLLAAIGILIILKQIPVALGYYQGQASLQELLRTTEETLDIPYVIHAFWNMHLIPVVITFSSLGILLIWEKYFSTYSKKIPGPVLVIPVAIAINLLANKFMPEFALKTQHLVNIPVMHSYKELLSQLRFPDFNSFHDIRVYTVAGMMAIVASLETLLNLEGIEKIDRRHRYTSRDRELLAQGTGNLISGLLGGLPITSVIVRSSVNIYSGATSKISTIFHGVFLLISITLIPQYLNYIPLPALAAILIHTGYKLSSVSLFRKAYSEGKRYFVPFLVTTVAIVFSNLLMGILIGLTVSILFILHYNTKYSFTVVNESHTAGNVLRFILPQQITFLNKAAIIDELNKIPKNAKVLIDANLTDYIDDDVLGVIRDFKEDQSIEKNILLNLTGFKAHYEIKNQIKFINATTHDVQIALTHHDALKILIEGNKRFILGTPIHKDFKHQIEATSQSQHPIGVVLSCIDSRVPVEIIFDLTLGDLFVSRIAGNIANIDVVASIEFACQVAQAKLVVILGHKECGAIKAACDNVEMGNITHLIEKIKPAIEMEKLENTPENKHQFIDNVIYNNVILTKQYILEKSDILKNLLAKNEINVIGAIYDIHTGEVVFEND